MVVSLTCVCVAKECRYRLTQSRINLVTIDIYRLDQTVGFAWSQVLLFSHVVVQDDIKDTLADRIRLSIKLNGVTKCLSGTVELRVRKSLWSDERRPNCHIEGSLKSNSDYLDQLGFARTLGSAYNNSFEASHGLNDTLTVVYLLEVDINFKLFGDSHDHVVHLLAEFSFLALSLHIVNEFDCGCVL